MRSILKLAGLSALLLSIHSAGGEEGLFRSTSACSQEAVCDSAQPEAPMPDNPMPKTIHILAPEFYCTNASVVTVRVLALPEAFEAGVFVKIKSMVESTPATPGPSAASVPFVEKDISGSISSGVVPDAAYDGNHGGLYDFGTVDLDVALHDPSVSMKDRKIWAIAYREGFNPAGEKVFTSGHEPAQLTQIKVDLDGREPGGADVVPDEEEESPGVLLASGSSKLVVQSILAAAGTAGGTLTLTWPDLFEGNKKLKVTRDDDGTFATDGTLSIDCAATALPLTLSLATLKQQTGGTWAEAEWDPDDQITVTMQHSGVAQCIDQVKLTIIKVDITDATDNFAPPLGEEATIELKLDPSPPSGGSFPGTFKLEVVRVLKDGSCQHVDWVDVDPSASGDQDERSLDFSTLSLTWDGTSDTGVSLAEGTDEFTGVTDSFYRKLPPIGAGEKVPPPYYTLVAKTLLPGVAESEDTEGIYVSQVVDIVYAPEAALAMIEEFIVDGTTIIPEITSLADFITIQDKITDTVETMYDGVNLVLGSSPDVPHSVIDVVEGSDGDPRGNADHTDFGNADAGKSARVYATRLRSDLALAYLFTPFAVPVTPDERGYAHGLTAAHELGHLLGLVMDNGVLDGSAGRHNKTPGEHSRLLMNPGNADDAVDDIGRNGSWSVKALNGDYLNFILPVP